MKDETMLLTMAAGLAAVVVGGIVWGVHEHDKNKNRKHDRHGFPVTAAVVQETRPIVVPWPRIPVGHVGMRPWERRTLFHPHF